MARLGNTFDATGVAPNQRGTIPDGYYTAMITDSEMKATKSGNGAYLQLTIQIVDGPQRGRRLIDRLNLDNPNQQAVDIAEATLSSICHAVGVMQVQDSVQLHGKRMTIDVITEDPREGYAAQNRISNYMSFTGTENPARREHTAPKPAARNSGGGAPVSSARRPWESPKGGGSDIDDADDISFADNSFDINMPLHRKPVVA